MRREIRRPVSGPGQALIAGLVYGAVACGSASPPSDGAGGNTGSGGLAVTAGAPAGAAGLGGAEQPAGGFGGESLGGASAAGTSGGVTQAGQSNGGTTSGGAGTGGAAGPGPLPPFILGADVTITLEDEYWGATYTDGGKQKPLEQLLKDHGFNFIRVDTFVNPSAPGGYAADKEQPFRDLAHTITLGKRVKAIGLGLLLDLHYSDTWTNPGAQTTPAAWAGLTLSALETKVYDYTKDAVTQLEAASARPDIVQIGNEITSGMLWDTGKAAGSNFGNFAALLKAGIKAVRDVDPMIQIMLHIDKCNDLETSKWWLDGVLDAGVVFDIFAQSCYASAPNGVAGYQGTPAQWKTTFAALAERYPDLKLMIAEYSAEQRAANDTMFDLPNHRGLGTFNWDPTRSYDTHPNHALFTTDGAWNKLVAVPELMALYEQMAKDYGLR